LRGEALPGRRASRHVLRDRREREEEEEEEKKRREKGRKRGREGRAEAEMIIS
jgi:hypothetical protein